MTDTTTCMRDMGNGERCLRKPMHAGQCCGTALVAAALDDGTCIVHRQNSRVCERDALGCIVVHDAANGPID